MELEALGLACLRQAAVVTLAIRRREEALKADPDQPELADELRILRAMQKELREVGSYARHYRDRGYCRCGICAAWPDR